jgi:hypothetical protein
MTFGQHHPTGVGEGSSLRRLNRRPRRCSFAVKLVCAPQSAETSAVGAPVEGGDLRFRA